MAAPIDAYLGATLAERYKISHLLGEGAFGWVFKAQRLDLKQDVALKILKEHAFGDSGSRSRAVARFRREAELCARLHHPNIVRVVDAGEGNLQAESDRWPPKQVLYTVFDYIPGQSLAEVIRREGAQPLKATARFMAQILDALCNAHSYGILHRDLKPQNIMISGTGLRRNALVLDFGLGCLTEQLQRDQSRLTATMELLGTPAYAAPEQLQGKLVTPRSDLYAWGLIFLECLSGSRVIKGRALTEVLRQQLGPTPITVPLWLQDTAIGPLLPRLLAKDPNRRIVDTQVLLESLESLEQQSLLDILEEPSQGDNRPRAEQPSSLSRPDEPTLIPGLLRPGTPAPTPAGTQLAERRTVTALALRLSLETRGAPLNIDDYDQALMGQVEGICEIAARFEGRVVSTVGTSLMLLFGLDLTREDDTSRAARAALMIRSELEQQGRELAKQGVILRIHCALHRGTLGLPRARIPGSDHGRAMVGMTLEVAQRALDSAEAGEILLTQATLGLISRHFETQPSSVTYYRLEGEASQALGTSTRPLQPLIGRHDTLERIVSAFRASASGPGPGLLLKGPAGVGKSRLLWEARRQLGLAEPQVILCRCTLESRTSALRPFAELLERLIGKQPGATPQEILGKLKTFLSTHQVSLHETLVPLAQVLGLPPEAGYEAPRGPAMGQRMARLAAMATLVGAFSREGAVLLEVEDLHWADPTSLALLQQLIGQPKVCVLLSARPAFDSPFDDAQLEVVELGPLDEGGSEQLMLHLMEGRRPPPEVRDRILSRAMGVPLFVEELTRSVLDSGALEVRGQHLYLVKPISSLNLPDTLNATLLARLDRLGDLREIVQLAAVLGPSFDLSLLEGIYPGDPGELNRALGTLEAASLIDLQYEGPSPQVRFHHGLIQEAAYGSLPLSRRRQLHGRVAGILEANFPQVPLERPELLAWHHSVAGSMETAIRYAQKAAQRALQRSAYSETLEQANLARQWLPEIETAPTRLELELSLNSVISPALLATRGFADDEVRRFVEDAKRLLEQSPDSPYITPVLWTLQMYHHLRSETGPARQSAESLLERAEASGDMDQLIACLPSLGSCFYGEARFEEARAHLERCISLYDIEKHGHHAAVFGWDSRGFAQSSLALVLWSMGYPDQALARAQDGVASGVELEDAMSTAQAYIYLAIVHQYRGEREEVARVCQEALVLCQRHGVPMAGALCTVLLAWATDDLQTIQAALMATRAMGVTLASSFYRLLEAEVAWRCGNAPQALKTIAEIRAYVQTTKEIYYLPEVLRLEAQIRAEDPASEAILEEALLHAKKINSPPLIERVAHDLVARYVARGEDERRADLIAKLKTR